METIRTFIAVPLPPPILAEIAHIQQRLEKRVPPRTVRWVRPEGIHLTLKFLGDTRTDRVPAICEALAGVAQQAQACTFTVGELGCFPNTRRPRVIWVGIQDPSGRLAVLQDAVEEAVARFGYPPEGRGFTPHLTLGRVQRNAVPADTDRIGAVVAGTEVGGLGQVVADHFALIRSLLQPSGAQYTTLHTFRLGQ